jgi:hypothetical protein
MYWHKVLSEGNKNKCEKEIAYLRLLNVYKLFCKDANSLTRKFIVHDQHIARFMKLYKKKKNNSN